MKIAAYCRVSTDKDEQLESLANQTEFFGQFAKLHGHELVKVYSDEGITGRQMKKRTQFLQMIKDARTHLFDMIVVKDVSRYARNTVDLLTSIRELKTMGVDVQFISNNQTVIGNSEFMITLFGAMAQEESANLSTRVKFGKKQNAKKGKVPNFVYGYDWVNRFELKINPDQAAIVKRIYKEYVDEGLGLRRIGLRLDKDNVLAPSGGNRWSTKTLKGILSNPIYKGTLISRKSECIDFLSGTRKNLEPEPDFTFKREEYRIVSDEYFDKAKTILARRAKQYENKNPQNGISSKYTFSGLIKCEYCGYSYTRRLSNNRVNPKYAYWKCNGNNVRGSNYCPNNVTIKDEDMINILTDYFLNIVSNPSKLTELLNNTDSEEEIDTNVIRLQIKSLENKKEKFLSMYINEIIPIERLKQETVDIENSISELKTKLAPQEKKKPSSPKKLIEYINSFLTNGAFTNTELKKILEGIYVNQNREITIKFKDQIDE